MSTTNDNNPQGTAEDWQTGQLFEVNWEQLTFEELQAGYLRQQDYTRKTQELAEERKAIASVKSSDEPTDEEKATLEWLSKQGYVRKDDLESLQKKAKLEAELDDLLDANPGLKQYEKALKAIQSVDGRSYEEVAIEHGFLSAWDKLERAKTSRQKMVSDDKPRQKTISDMSSEEYAKRKKEGGYTGNIGSTLSGAR